MGLMSPWWFQGEDWEEGFASGLLNSLCFFPLLSYGATAPLAAIPQSGMQQAVDAGWEVRPVGRARLCGNDSDPEDNVLKEFLIAATLLHQVVGGGEEAPAIDGNGTSHPNGGDSEPGNGKAAQSGSEMGESRLQVSFTPPQGCVG